MSDLASALMVAIRVHARQVDKQGEPYLLHVLRVVDAVSDDAKVVAALHDVLEDSDRAFDSVAEDCDLSVLEGLALSLLNRPEHETYAAYANWSAQHAVLLAREVKLADLCDNLERIPSDAELQQRREAPSYGAFCGPLADPALYVDWRSLGARYEKAIATLEAADA